MSVPQLRAILWCAVSDKMQAKEEKASLEEQERLLREMAEREDWRVVDTLIVPGFSRRYYNYPEFMNAAQADEIDAPKRLMDHWQAKDFDVLACRYGSRFAREQSIFGEVVARTIDMNARIYNLQDGWVDQSNYRMFISMGGYAASKEVDELKQRYQMGMTKRAERGLPVSNNVVISHQVVRDELGNAVELVVNEDRRRLFDDIAALLLEGLSWNELPNALYEQYGHATTKGKPYAQAVLWRTLHSPWFWGHGARRYSDNESRISNYGMWCYDESAPPPSGAIVFRNTHEPMYTGDLAEQVKAELKRRSTLIKGRAANGTASPFSGLVYCGSCGYRMRYKWSTGKRWAGYTCVSREPVHRLKPRASCTTEPRSITMDIVTTWVKAHLNRLLDNETVEDLLPVADDVPQPRIEALQAEIETVERRIEGLLLQRIDTPQTAQGVLSDLVDRAGKQLDTLCDTLETAQRQQLETKEKRQAVTYTLEALREMGLNQFWEQENPVINRMLMSLLGDKRIIVLDGTIMGIAVPVV